MSEIEIRAGLATIVCTRPERRKVVIYTVIGG
jgi:hypothetical protein